MNEQLMMVLAWWFGLIMGFIIGKGYIKGKCKAKDFKAQIEALKDYFRGGV